MKIIAKRGVGDMLAPDITDPLCCEIPAALQRGRVKMDAGEGLLPVEQECVFRASALLGDPNESFDELNGVAWRGLVTAVEHSFGEDGELVTRQSFLRRLP